MTTRLEQPIVWKLIRRNISFLFLPRVLRGLDAACRHVCIRQPLIRKPIYWQVYRESNHLETCLYKRVYLATSYLEAYLYKREYKESNHLEACLYKRMYLATNYLEACLYKSVCIEQQIIWKPICINVCID